MSDATLRIKNLSIALEALSRIGISDGRYNHFAKIEDLLDQEIQDLWKEKEKENQWPPRARPAATILDDGLPF